MHCERGEENGEVYLAAHPTGLLNQCPENHFMCTHVLTVRDVQLDVTCDG